MRYSHPSRERARQAPQQETVDRPKREFALIRELPGAVDIVQ